MLSAAICNYCSSCIDEFDTIDLTRKRELIELSKIIASNTSDTIPLNLVFICTHNSRRSQFGQIWATIAAHYFNVPVTTYSAGIEVTAFHPNALKVIKDIGVGVERLSKEINSPYKLTYGYKLHHILFSKLIDHYTIPTTDFLAIMTCEDAAENCPFIPTAKRRFPLTYEDPKKYDQTSLEAVAYARTCRQIATELLYVFKNID